LNHYTLDLTTSTDLSSMISANQTLVSTILSHVSEIPLSQLGYNIPVYAPKSTAPPLTMASVVINRVNSGQVGQF